MQFQLFSNKHTFERGEEVKCGTESQVYKAKTSQYFTQDVFKRASSTNT